MIKLLIADDHPLVLEGIKHIISNDSDMKIGAEAHNGQEVLNAVFAEHWDVVVLDLDMPGKDGFDVIKEMRCEFPSLPILVLSFHPENQLAVRVLKAGASGYMTKETAPKELIKAIRKVHSGQRYISEVLAEKLLDTLILDPNEEPHAILSDREFQILCLYAAGKSATEIGKKYSISVKTVRSHRDRAVKKLHLKNNAELTRYAIEHKLI